MNVDVPPSISGEQKGSEVEVSSGGFKLGPHDGDKPDAEELEPHADAVRWRLVNNGVRGKVLGVFFDAPAADSNAWFTSEDNAAKASAITNGDGSIDKDEDIIAWRSDSVNYAGRDGGSGKPSF